MKRGFCLLVAIVLLLSLPLVVFAHSGRTDSSGGHYDRSTGEYHYHHGYPAHQHTNGYCPYNFDDNTDHGEGKSPEDNHKDVASPTKSVEKNNHVLEIVIGILLGGFLGFSCGLMACVLISAIKAQRQKQKIYALENISRPVKMVCILIGCILGVLWGMGVF